MVDNNDDNDDNDDDGHRSIGNYELKQSVKLLYQSKV